MGLTRPAVTDRNTTSPDHHITGQPCNQLNLEATLRGVVRAMDFLTAILVIGIPVVLVIDIVARTIGGSKR